MLQDDVVDLINWLDGKVEEIDFGKVGNWLELMKVHRAFSKKQAHVGCIPDLLPCHFCSVSHTFQ